MKQEPRPEAAPDFLALLDPDPVRAADKSEALYDRLVNFFFWQNCRAPADLASETFLRGLKRIAEGVVLSPPDPTPFFFGIARNLIKEDWKQQQREMLPLEEDSAIGATTLDAVESDISLQQALSQLSDRDRALVLRYHSEDRRALSRELGLKESTMRVQVYRIFKRLKKACGTIRSGVKQSL